MAVKRTKTHTVGEARPKARTTPGKAEQTGANPRPESAPPSAVPTFQPEGAKSLAPLTLGDLKELGSSMAAEGFVVPHKRFVELVEEVKARMADGNVSDAIRQAQHWLANSRSGSPPAPRQDTAADAESTAGGGAATRREGEPAISRTHD